MKPDELEQKLSRQSLRQMPATWRGEILSAARAAEPSGPAPAVASLWRGKSCVTHHSWLSTINHQLSTLFWPHPKAWAGLAAVWVFIFVLNFSTRETSPKEMAQSTPPSPEVIVELKKQQRLFAELVGSHEPADADRPRIFSPKPRSERMGILVT